MSVISVHELIVGSLIHVLKMNPGNLHGKSGNVSSRTETRELYFLQTTNEPGDCLGLSNFEANVSGVSSVNR